MLFLKDLIAVTDTTIVLTLMLKILNWKTWFLSLHHARKRFWKPCRKKMNWSETNHKEYFQTFNTFLFLYRNCRRRNKNNNFFPSWPRKVVKAHAGNRAVIKRNFTERADTLTYFSYFRSLIDLLLFQFNQLLHFFTDFYLFIIFFFFFLFDIPKGFQFSQSS